MATINISFDQTTAGAPAGFQTAVLAAAAELDSVITSSLTETISVGWGYYGGSTPIGGNTLAEAFPASGIYVSYGQLRTDLQNAPVMTPALQSLLASMPAADPSNGQFWYISEGQQQALGLLPAVPSDITGYAGFSASAPWTYDDTTGVASGTYDLTAVALHELTHAMGRVDTDNLLTTLDLASYKNGQIDLTNADAGRQFSIDGGKTSLTNWDPTNSDPSDFGGTNPTDPDNAFIDPGVKYAWSQADSDVMQIMGYTTAPLGNPPPPSNIVITDGPTLTGQDGTVWSIVHGQVAANGVVDQGTNVVVALEKVGNTIEQENAAGHWYGKGAATDPWTQVASPGQPTLNVSSNNTLLTDLHQSIVDQSQNMWFLYDNGSGRGEQVVINGQIDNTTAGVVELAYVNGTLWQENWQGLWWGKSSPDAPWIGNGDQWGDGTPQAPFTGPTTPPNPASGSYLMAQAPAAWGGSLLTHAPQDVLYMQT